MYSEKVMQHFKTPHNMGEIKNADGIGKIGNPTCGDLMYCYIKVGKNEKGQEVLKDIKVKTFGCVAAIATSSMITDLAIGKTLDEAKKITRDNVKDALNGLPPIKVHCSNLAADALHKAIEDYENRKKGIIEKQEFRPSVCPSTGCGGVSKESVCDNSSKKKKSASTKKVKSVKKKR